MTTETLIDQLTAERDQLREDLADVSRGWDSATEALRELQTERDQWRARAYDAEASLAAAQTACELHAELRRRVEAELADVRARGES